MMHLLSSEHDPIRFEGISKSFGAHQVLDGVDLILRAGETTAIVGPNGAGKTTLIKCLLGLVRPSSGTIFVDGKAVNGEVDYRRHIGYMPQHASFPDNLTGREIVKLIKTVRQNEESLDLTLERLLRLEKDLDKPFRTLSGGTQQKISAVVAFMFQPPLYVLDEPTAGLDPVASGALKDHIRTVRDAGATMILTSHVMADLEELSDRIVFLLDGRILFDGTMQTISELTGENRLERAVAKLQEGEAA